VSVPAVGTLERLEDRENTVSFNQMLVELIIDDDAVIP
jgi:hypothetical protein